MREFSVYYADFSSLCLVAYDYFLFRRGAHFIIFSCDINLSPATQILNGNRDGKVNVIIYV